jgi:hypothetical protein
MKFHFVHNLKYASIGTFMFIIGFSIGVLLDLVFYNIYKKVDPKEESDLKLITLIFMQLFVLAFIGYSTFDISKDWKLSYFMRLGIFSSQIFLLGYGVRRITKKLYKRKDDPNPVKLSSMMSKVVGIQTA